MGYSRRFNKEEADLKNRSNKNGVVFFNAYSNNRSRNWPIENVPEFIKKLRKMSSFADSVFIVNIPPGTKRKDFVFMEKELSSRIFIFSADENFFQLPAILSLCDLVISTETSVMHLSRMLNVPLVVLMRDNCLEWKPYKLSDENIIFALNHSWIKDIPVNLVVDKIEKLYGV